MSAAEALRAAHAAGITVTVDGESLVLEANAEPPQSVLNVLARHKLALLALLRSGQDVWVAENWRARFDERAGFLEHDGGLLRNQAELQAFEHCIVEWLNANPCLDLRDRRAAANVDDVNPRNGGNEFGVSCARNPVSAARWRGLRRTRRRH
jgi:hypothetical protein